MKTEPGHRLYIKKKLTRKIEAEAKALGISLDEMILVKLNSNSGNSSHEQQTVKNLVQRTQHIEAILLQLIKLIESGLIDTGYVRGAIESQANPEAIARAENLEIRRAKLISQIRQELEKSTYP